MSFSTSTSMSRTSFVKCFLIEGRYQCAVISSAIDLMISIVLTLTLQTRFRRSITPFFLFVAERHFDCSRGFLTHGTVTNKSPSRQRRLKKNRSHGQREFDIPVVHAVATRRGSWLPFYRGLKHHGYTHAIATR